MVVTMRQSLLGGGSVVETFQQAEVLELDALEWDVDTHFDADPLWQPAGRQALVRQQNLRGIPIGPVSLGQLKRTGLAHTDDEVRRFAVRFTGEGIRHAAEVGAPAVIVPFHGSAALRDGGDLAQFRRTLPRLTELAAARGVELLLETDLPTPRLLPLLQSLQGLPLGMLYAPHRQPWPQGQEAAELLGWLRAVRMRLPAGRPEAQGGLPAPTAAWLRALARNRTAVYLIVETVAPGRHQADRALAQLRRAFLPQEAAGG